MKLIYTQVTIMGDKYLIYQTVSKEGKTYYVSYINNLYDDWNLKCHGSPSRYTAISYFKDVQNAQQDTLNGFNPYLSKSNAWAYKICSSQDISISDEEFIRNVKNQFSSKIDQDIINKAINLKIRLQPKKKIESTISTIKKKVSFNI